MRKLIYIVLLLCSVPFISHAQDKQKVMVMEIKDEIDPRMSRYVKLALEHAEETKADIIIIDMDTFGGALDDAKKIVDWLMAEKRPVWVFVNSDAASAGALISIACDSIYMAPGATIGAATVVTGSGEAAPDKYQSYMRSIMRSTAEENGRNPQIAEAMVDESLEVDSVNQAGKVITFTTSEAIKFGYCEAKVETIEEIIKRNKIESYEIDRFQLGTTEKIIAFFLNPFISGILILIILGGIYFELQTPGIGFPLFAALTALVLYLVPYYLNGLADYWEIIALFLGIVLLLVELFVIPGFGVTGVSGIILIVSSMILIMLNNDFFNFEFVPLGDIIVAAFATVGGLSGGLLLLFFGGARLSKTKAFQRIALTDTQDKEAGYTVNTFSNTLIGKKGVAHTVLRPGGKIIIDDQIYDAFTRGDYVEKGETVEVIGNEGITLKVKKVV